MRAFDFATKLDWAILTEVDAVGEVRAPHLKRILDIAARAHEPDFEAVTQKLADRVDEAGILEMRGPVAVVNVIGPIFRYANLFTWISGATSVQELATAFRSAVEDSKVAAIVLNIDSPGGEVAGISELATAIYEARQVKPVIAYADDLTASGAYWIASAASKIVASDTAQLGSIGVVATVVQRGPRDGVKEYQFVSNVSPNKRPDLASDEGRATIQQRVDDLAAVFVRAIARNRGVSEAKVAADFGRGGVLIAEKAIAAGMADHVGTFEGLVSALEGDPRARSLAAALQIPYQVVAGDLSNTSFGAASAAQINEGGNSMPEPSQAAEHKPAAPAPAAPAVDAEAAKAEAKKEGAKSERARISAILNAEEAKDRQKQARALALDTDLDAESARKVLAASPVENQQNPLAQAMAGVQNPTVGAGSGESDDVNAEIAKTLALMGQAKKEGK